MRGDPVRFPVYVLVASAAVLGGALLSQYWGGLAPCELCLYQRWPWAAAIVISLIAIMVGSRSALPWVALVLAAVFAIGSALAFYHVGVEKHWFEGPSACTAAATAADTLEALKAQILRQQPVRCDEVGLVAVGYFARRLEPPRLARDGWKLSCCPPVAAPAAARRHAPGDRMSDGRPHRLPGDPDPAEEIARILRVDHAGEYGATRIYQGQLDLLGRGRTTGEIRRMAETEKRHLARFETLLHERRVRPTLLHPIWSVAGYALGAATALLGERAAMACTVAIEDVIDEHYQRQAERLADADPGLRETILAFRDDEIAHREVAIAQGAEDALGYDLISAAVKAGSRMAIWLSTRL